MELEEARAVIRAQDAVIADAFTLRMKAVKAIAEYKRAHGLPVLDPAQEERVLRAGSER
ncbi:MAG: chorismate mutase, partial [Oscillospiraceae bacterium]|nr:chorismate mutase [Oscillospiraceae bacterium]